MTKDDQRRVALIEKLADHMLIHGLSGSSLRALAKAAGTSDRMLLYYFRDKDELLAATSERIAARLTIILAGRMAPTPLAEDALIAHLIAVLGEEECWPYMRLWLEMASRAAGGEFGTICTEVRCDPVAFRPTPHHTDKHLHTSSPVLTCPDSEW